MCDFEKELVTWLCGMGFVDSWSFCCYRLVRYGDVRLVHVGGI